MWNTLSAHRLSFDLRHVRNQFVIPIHMRRPTSTGKTYRFLPIPAALRAHAARIKRVPDTPAYRPAHPSIRRSRHPLALRTKYFHFSHIAIAPSKLILSQILSKTEPKIAMSMVALRKDPRAARRLRVCASKQPRA
jgi:hypothetical protein